MRKATPSHFTPLLSLKQSVNTTTKDRLVHTGLHSAPVSWSLNAAASGLSNGAHLARGFAAALCGKPRAFR